MFLIFCLVNMVMAIDVLMKYALRFLHSMSGCVPVDIKNCTAVACLFYFWLFVWGRQRAGGKRQANIAQAVSARSKTSFVMEFTACCSAAYKVIAVSKKGSICSISLAYPCRSNYEPDYSSKPCEGKKIIESFWQDDLNLENVILLTLYDSHFFFLFWKRNLKIQINIQRSAFAFCHAWCNVSHSGLIPCTLQPIFIQNIVPAFK